MEMELKGGYGEDGIDQFTVNEGMADYGGWWSWREGRGYVIITIREWK